MSQQLDQALQENQRLKKSEHEMDTQLQVMRQMLDDRESRIAELEAELERKTSGLAEAEGQLKDKKAHNVLQHWVIKYMILKDKKQNKSSGFKMPTSNLTDNESIVDAISQICPSAFDCKSSRTNVTKKSKSRTRKMSNSRNAATTSVI
jgi:chromosome segregation ATPase